VGFPQVGSPQVGSPQVGSPQVGSPQVGSPQVGFQQVGFHQVGFQQVGSPQVGSTVDIKIPDFFACNSVFNYHRSPPYFGFITLGFCGWSLSPKVIICSHNFPPNKTLTRSMGVSFQHDVTTPSS
jgi:hypothetical protein